MNVENDLPLSSETHCLWRCVWVCLFFLCVLTASQVSWAQEQRVALLVVNQHGWKGDPFLRYAVSGDLNPLGQELKRLGFQVHRVINREPSVLRQVLKGLRAAMKQRGRSTFLFYYSGHADRSHLHMGPNTKAPFSYKEFLSFFRGLRSQRRLAIFDACFSGEVIRLFGSLSRYKQLLKEGRLKGVKRKSQINISRLRFPNQGQEQGLRIITSSLQMSWELNRYKASVFTHHLLRGIRGAADLDQDGKISVDELFDFTSREVKLVTGQKPQQLVVARRSRPYALAPAYHSRLQIGAQVTGTLQVSVSNFLWTHRKLSRQPLTLALVHGRGMVRLRDGKRCWQQAIVLPKGAMKSLGKRWKQMPCPKMASLRQKGGLSLPVKLAPPLPRLEGWQLSLAAGMALQGAGSLQRIQPTLSVGLGWKFLQWELGFSHGLAGGGTFSLTRLFVQTALGLPLTWSFAAGELGFFVGGLLRGGLVMQHLSQETYMNLHGVAGATLQLSWWFSQWGLRLGTSAGVDLTPTNGGVGASPFWQVTSAVVWAI